MNKFIDLIGLKFGRLTVQKYIGESKWLCKCDCGEKIIAMSGNLKNGHTKSCGCIRNEKTRQRSFKHGHSIRGKRSRTYRIWSLILSRCKDSKNPSYRYYGGRIPQIKVCSRWSNKKNGFINFLKDVGEIPKGKQIDRINNNKGYNPNNFRLVTSKENNRNRRDNHLIPFNDKNLTIAEWSEITNISCDVIGWRLKRGWSIEKSLTTPVRKHKKYKNSRK